MTLRPGTAARFAFGAPGACDRTVAGSRIRVTLPGAAGGVTVDLDGSVSACDQPGEPLHAQALELPAS